PAGTVKEHERDKRQGVIVSGVKCKVTRGSAENSRISGAGAFAQAFGRVSSVRNHHGTGRVQERPPRRCHQSCRAEFRSMVVTARPFDAVAATGGWSCGKREVSWSIPTRAQPARNQSPPGPTVCRG